MRSPIDLSSLYRSTVGFDRLFELLEGATPAEPAGKWPPYDIERTGNDTYRISVAVAGFSPDEIEVSQDGVQLKISGTRSQAPSERQMLHQGIAFRNFRTAFSLADHVKVASADMSNGMLIVDLVREIPERLKPRKIPIASSAIAGSSRNEAEHLRIEQAA